MNPVTRRARGLRTAFYTQKQVYKIYPPRRSASMQKPGIGAPKIAPRTQKKTSRLPLEKEEADRRRIVSSLIPGMKERPVPGKPFSLRAELSR